MGIKRWGLVVGVGCMLGAATFAWGDTRVSMSSVPAADGATVPVRVTMINTDANVRLLRGVQWDFSVPHPNLTYAALFDFDLPQNGAAYFSVPELPVAYTAYTDFTPDPLRMLILPANASVTTGRIDVTNHTGGMIAGSTESWRAAGLDLFNPSATALHSGATATFGFGTTPDDPITIWRANVHNFNSGVPSGPQLTYVPEPASLGLLVLGAAAMIRKARKS